MPMTKPENVSSMFIEWFDQDSGRHTAVFHQVENLCATRWDVEVNGEHRISTPTITEALESFARQYLH